jgi:hypothetical protein
LSAIALIFEISLRNSVIKLAATLFIFGLAYSGQAPAQEWEPANLNDPADGSPAGMTQNCPFIYLPGMNSPLEPSAVPHELNHNHNRHLDRRSYGKPVVVLPIPMGGGSGYNNMQGFQYPGSYMPPDTPLHKFNGYVACDPPDPLDHTEATGVTAGAPARRLVKITSTRSLAAPGHQQPCPVYTINGEIPKQKGHTTTTKPAGPSVSGTMRQGER